MKKLIIIGTVLLLLIITLTSCLVVRYSKVHETAQYKTIEKNAVFIRNEIAATEEGEEGGVSIGSGCYVMSRVIVTNYHVVRPKVVGETVQVGVLVDGGHIKFREATIVNFDPVVDLAVLTTKETNTYNVIDITTPTHAGDTFKVVDASLGMPFSYHEGYISNMDLREPGREHLMSVVGGATFGASGSCLIGADGTVQGIFSAMLVPSQGGNVVELAIKKDVIRRVLNTKTLGER